MHSSLFQGLFQRHGPLLGSFYTHSIVLNYDLRRCHSLCQIIFWNYEQTSWLHLGKTALFLFWVCHFKVPVILALIVNVSHVRTQQQFFVLWGFRGKGQVTPWPWHSDFQGFVSHQVLLADTCSRPTCLGPRSLILLGGKLSAENADVARPGAKQFICSKWYRNATKL